jgi:hypothetical protein
MDKKTQQLYHQCRGMSAEQLVMRMVHSFRLTKTYSGREYVLALSKHTYTQPNHGTTPAATLHAFGIELKDAPYSILDVAHHATYEYFAEYNPLTAFEAFFYRYEGNIEELSGFGTTMEELFLAECSGVFTVWHPEQIGLLTPQDLADGRLVAVGDNRTGYLIVGLAVMDLDLEQEHRTVGVVSVCHTASLVHFVAHHHGRNEFFSPWDWDNFLITLRNRFYQTHGKEESTGYVTTPVMFAALDRHYNPKQWPFLNAWAGQAPAPNTSIVHPFTEPVTKPVGATFNALSDHQAIKENARKGEEMMIKLVQAYHAIDPTAASGDLSEADARSRIMFTYDGYQLRSAKVRMGESSKEFVFADVALQTSLIHFTPAHAQEFFLTQGFHRYGLDNALTYVRIEPVPCMVRDAQ